MGIPLKGSVRFGGARWRETFVRETCVVGGEIHFEKVSERDFTRV